MLRFTEELIARVDRAGASGVKLLRADSGLWSTKVFGRLEQAGWEYSIGVRMIKQIKEIVDEIDETTWMRVEDYPADGEAQIAETTYGERRLILRRTRLLGKQAELWPDWRHFCFVTNRAEDLALVEAEHRDHAVVEQSSPTSETRRSRTSRPGTTRRTVRGQGSARAHTQPAQMDTADRTA